MAKRKAKKNADDIFDGVEFEEENYLTMDGSRCKRYINAHLNNGNLIEDGDTVLAGPAMAASLLRRVQFDRRIGEDVKMFRMATEDEIADWKAERSTEDLAHADISKLGALAREESISAGLANPQTEESSQVTKSIEESRKPARRRRASQE